MSNLLLACGSVILTLVIAVFGFEVSARFLPGRFLGRDVFMGGNHPRGLVREDPELAYTLTPGFKSRNANAFKDFDVLVEINSQGLRDREPGLKDCDDIVIGLGDSYTFGEGVALDSTYLSLLEGRLRRASGEKICVIKAGVPGYGLHQMSAMYRRLAAKHPHRLVLVGLIADDLARINRGFVSYSGWIVLEEQASVLQACRNGDVHVRKAVLNPLHHYLVCNSRFYSWLVSRSLPGTGGRLLGSVLLPDLPPRRPSGNAIREPETFFREMKLVSDRNGAAILVVALCFDDRRLAASLASLGIGHLAIPCDRSWYFEHDRHINERGHAAVAEVIADHLGNGIAGARRSGPAVPPAER